MPSPRNREKKGPDFTPLVSKIGAESKLLTWSFGNLYFEVLLKATRNDSRRRMTKLLSHVKKMKNHRRRGARATKGRDRMSSRLQVKRE